MQSECLKHTNLIIHPATHCAQINGIDIGLTRLEFKVLIYLMEHMNIAISRQELLKTIWQVPCTLKTRTTDDTIKRLRFKLKENYASLRIETIRGFGYIIRE